MSQLKRKLINKLKNNLLAVIEEEHEEVKQKEKEVSRKKAKKIYFRDTKAIQICEAQTSVAVGNDVDDVPDLLTDSDSREEDFKSVKRSGIVGKKYSAQQLTESMSVSVVGKDIGNIANLVVTQDLIINLDDSFNDDSEAHLQTPPSENNVRTEEDLRNSRKEAQKIRNKENYKRKKELQETQRLLESVTGITSVMTSTNFRQRQISSRNDITNLQHHFAVEVEVDDIPPPTPNNDEQSHEPSRR